MSGNQGYNPGGGGNAGGHKGKKSANRSTAGRPQATYFMPDAHYPIHQNVLRMRIRSYLGNSATFLRYGYSEDRQQGVGNFYRAEHDFTQAQLEDLVRETTWYNNDPEGYQQRLDGQVLYTRPRNGSEELQNQSQGNWQRYDQTDNSTAYDNIYQNHQQSGRHDSRQQGSQYAQQQQTYGYDQQYPAPQQQQPSQYPTYQGTYQQYGSQVPSNPTRTSGTANGYAGYDTGITSAPAYPNTAYTASGESSSSMQAQNGSPGAPYSEQYGGNGSGNGYDQGQGQGQNDQYGRGYYPQ